jgi:integrase
MKSEIIRKTFPKIRTVFVKGEKFYQVDARRKGTNGRRETFAKKSEAETRAAAIEKDFAGNGTDGLAMPADLRAMAFQGQTMLAPFGKTIFQACEFYRDYLKAEQAKQESALVKILAEEWYQDKKSNTRKTLRQTSINGIYQAKMDLAAAFGERKIRSVTHEEIGAHIDKQPVGRYRKIGMRSYFSQFFNWAIAKGHTDKNPVSGIEIEAEERDVVIFDSETAKKIMKVCEEKFADFILYYAISLFAGLRPEECKLLKWEQIHFEEKQITVLGETSKHKDTRPVTINDTLMEWFNSYAPALEERKGFVTRQKNFANRAKLTRSAFGFRHFKENKEAGIWPQDAPRHSFASHWLPIHKNRAELAELMGNSVDVIKKHYRKVVPNSEANAYWDILPKGAAERKKKDKEAAKGAFPTP